MGRKWMGVVAAAAVLVAGSAGAVEQQAKPGQQPQAQQKSPDQQAPTAPQGSEAEQQEPLEPILVQGFVKSVGKEQMTLTAPGAPVDLPLSLHEETRFIQGEKDVKQADVKEGQLVRAALLPMGDDLVALVVEVVPEEPQAAPGQEQPSAPGGEGGLQGEEPPSEPAPITPSPSRPSPAEPTPSAPSAPESGDTTEL
ncbi:hypothetical protein [Vulgatibacter sp.]|uniref:hypothetical protein n=1 Tax=Vulgatibacter sp. TaxID=1971226 RepID=UPI003567AC58